MKKLVAWVKEHKALAIALSGGILLLIYLYYSSQQQNAANAAAASAAQAASGQPSDAILSQEMQVQAALQQEQIAAQAQATQYGYQAQVDLATIQAQEQTSNAQTQAALTLGLAQAGDSTSSILQLLGAQPATVATSSTIGNSTTTPTAAATVTGAAATGGTGKNTQTNPAPVTALPPAADPAQAAAGQVDAWGNPVSCPPGMHYAAGACIHLCDQASVGDQWACVQSNEAIWNAPYQNPTQSAPTPPSQPTCGPGTHWDGSACVTIAAPPTQSQPSLPARGAAYQTVVPAHGGISPHAVSATADVAMASDTPFSESDVTGTVAGHASIVTNVVHSTPQVSRGNLAAILGMSAVVSPSVIPAAGGPFYNPPQNDVIRQGYTVDAGGIMNSVHNSAPVDWNTVIEGYGVQDAANLQTAIHYMFGPNQPMPLTTLGVSGVG